MRRHSLFFIKPEMVDRRQDVFKYITDSGLQIACTHDVVMTHRHLRRLYGHVADHVMMKLKLQMLGHRCVVGIVKSEKDAIGELVRICGEKTAPSDCHAQSIRYQLGSHRDNEIHINAVHRPTNEKELDQNLALFGLLAFNS
jgi:nucleoside diphosphate kinase